MRAGLLFLAGAWAGWVIGAAISVYGLDQLVRPYNAWASFGILATSTVIPSGAIGLGAWLGARGISLPLRVVILPALAMGLLCTIVFFAGDALSAVSFGETIGMLVVWVALPVLAALWTRRLARVVPSTPAP